MRIIAVAAVAAMALAGAASAAEKAENGWLTLKSKTSRNNVILDGAVWTCKVDVCRAPKVKSLPAERVCRQLSAKLGEIATFGYRGEELSAEAVAACNADAKAG